MVVRSPLGWEPMPSRPFKGWRYLIALVVVVIVAVLVLNSISVDYYALSPGESLAVNGTNGVITVGTRHVGSGELLLTTVEIAYKVTLWQKLFAFEHPNTQLVKQASLTGGVSSQQFNTENQQAMIDSQVAAKVAAFRRLGYPVTEHGDGALIVAVAVHTPADGVLDAGDVITKIGGAPIATAADATRVFGTRTVGVPVALQITRPGTPPVQKTISIAPVTCGPTDCPTAPNRPLVGIDLQTDNDTFSFPKSPAVNIDTSDIGGPSAGLAFTLGVLDALSPAHDLTGGHRVGVTGEISVDGQVLDVGGVQQKTVSVENAGCQYFLVPPGEYQDAEAKAKGHHLTVVKVATLDDALRFLQTIGGNMTGIPQKSPLPAS